MKNTTNIAPFLSPMTETRRVKEAIKRNSKPIHKHCKHEDVIKCAQQHEVVESPSAKAAALKNLFSCKEQHQATEGNSSQCKRIGCSGSICKLREMEKREGKRRSATTIISVIGSTAERSCNIMKKKPLREITPAMSNSTSLSSTSSSSLIGNSLKGMPLRRFSGCYECHSVVNSLNGVSRDVSLRATICSCSHCEEIFMNAESLELHQRVRHAVTELSHEDSSRNIVEIIFQSSWLKKPTPTCKIDRILKINNTQKTIARFEDYRDSIKFKASSLAKKHPRCTADGNELLRFHCSTLKCSLGLNGTTNLCNSIPQCELCSIIRDGFKTDKLGRILTTATSGRAHDSLNITADEEVVAMLVCRVIAGRVKKNQEFLDDHDSVAGTAGSYSNLDELFVFSPKSILPCFVVIYKG